MNESQAYINNKRYKVVLQAEDGTYTLKDGLISEKAAIRKLKTLELNYGEGQQLYIEEYRI